MGAIKTSPLSAGPRVPVFREKDQVIHDEEVLIVMSGSILRDLALFKRLCLVLRRGICDQELGHQLDSTNQRWAKSFEIILCVEFYILNKPRYFLIDNLAATCNVYNSSLSIAFNLPEPFKILYHIIHTPYTYPRSHKHS